MSLQLHSGPVCNGGCWTRWLRCCCVAAALLLRCCAALMRAVICVNWTQTRSGHAASASGISRWSRTAAGPTRLASRARGRDDAVNTLGPVMFAALSQRMHTFSDAHPSGCERREASNTHPSLPHSKAELQRLLPASSHSVFIISLFFCCFFFFFLLLSKFGQELSQNSQSRTELRKPRVGRGVAAACWR